MFTIIVKSTWISGQEFFNCNKPKRRRLIVHAVIPEMHVPHAFDDHSCSNESWCGRKSNPANYLLTTNYFIMIKNNKGPTLAPCGTPAGTVFHLEKQSSLNLTLCLQSVMKFNIQSRVVLEISFLSACLAGYYVRSYRRLFGSQKWLCDLWSHCICTFIPGV